MPRPATTRLVLALASLIAAACSRVAPATSPAPRFGDLMAEVGHRFERAGRAAGAGRFALARYDIGELRELFEEDAPRAQLPAGANFELHAQAQAFAHAQLGPLEQAATRADKAQFARAFAAAAAACNACHVAAGRGFLVVPSQPGEAVPLLTDVTPTGT